MQAKEAKDLTKATKDAKKKEKDDYDKLTEPEKQVKREALIAHAIPFIDQAIRDACQARSGRVEEQIRVNKNDPLLEKMDAQAITQLLANYSDFNCLDASESIRIDWSESKAANMQAKGK